MFNGYFDSSLTCDYYVFASQGVWTETEESFFYIGMAEVDPKESGSITELVSYTG